MARSVTCEVLKRQARELADSETDAPTQSPVDDTEILGMLNASIGQWHTMLVQADPERFEAEVEFDATGAASYDLPADHYKTLGVDYQVADNAWWPLDRVMFQERTDYENSGSYAQGYRIKGTKLVLIPAPPNGTYRHTYITAAPVLDDDADTLDGANGWEQWVVYDVAIKILLKEESDAQGLMAKQAELKVEIEAAAAEREAATPRKVVGTRKRFFQLGDTL